MTSYRYGGIGLAAAIAMVVALGACGGGGDKQQTAEDQLDDALDQLSEDLDEPVDTTIEGEEAEAPPDPVVVDLDLPRSVDYQQATWTVTKVSYQGPGVDEFGTDIPAQAIVEFTVADTIEGGQDLTVDSSYLSLLDGDGARIPAEYDGVEQATVVFGGKSDFEASIPLDEDVTEDDLADYSFQVGQDGFEPAVIPLSGTVAEPGYPLNLTMPASVAGDVIGGPGTISNIHATVTLDYAGQRAEAGSRFIVVTGDVLFGPGYGHYLNFSDVRLSIDGIELERARPFPEIAEDYFPEGATASGSWVFIAPADGKDGALHFGGQSAPGTPAGPFSLPELP